jgi:hypothetical protein
MTERNQHASKQVNIKLCLHNTDLYVRVIRSAAVGYYSSES